MFSSRSDLQMAGWMQISNVWLLTNQAGQRFLIDTGDAVERAALKLFLYQAGLREPGDLTAILLTHAHRDHAGNAAWLRQRFACPVICHEADAAYLEGLQQMPPLADRPLALPTKVACKIQDWRPARCQVDETYKDGNWKWGFRVIHTPGHTAGSVMLYHEPTRTLFGGDSLLAMMPPLIFREKLGLAVAEYSTDIEQCHVAVRAWLAEGRPVARLASGHGPLVDKNVDEKLAALRRRPQSYHPIETTRGWQSAGIA